MLINSNIRGLEEIVECHGEQILIIYVFIFLKKHVFCQINLAIHKTIRTSKKLKKAIMFSNVWFPY